MMLYSIVHRVETLKCR